MATHINLLDWRVARRERRLEDFKKQMVAAALVGFAIALLWWMHAGSVLSEQESRNDMLRTEIKRLDGEIKEISELEAVQANLMARMQVIDSLQASRSATVHFFDQLVATLPDGLHINRLVQNGTEVTIDGVAESNARVSSYMKNLESSEWFDNPRLIVIRSAERDRVRQSDFTLRVKALTEPQNDDAEAADGD
ncbi:PilN domain-containing protein [Algiphilus sp.]|uniref:PilN domain-containing protein n=1 Tax=Algiphilus sp. TaxID=1872431 RepID=UPI0025C29468|nr:PilN domain-containing protein [Algiphilus sp.]MCK5770037.1 PilN domain-containing protein [Algiphilus sp.]